MPFLADTIFHREESRLPSHTFAFEGFKKYRRTTMITLNGLCLVFRAAFYRLQPNSRHLRKAVIKNARVRQAVEAGEVHGRTLNRFC